MKRTVFYLLLNLVTTISIFSQLSYPFQFLKTEGYFQSFSHLDSLQSEYKDHSFESPYWQALGTSYSFLGKYKLVIQSNCCIDSFLIDFNDENTLK